MLWNTLRDVRRDTALEFAPWLAERHHFVSLPSGRWCRTLGVPQGCTQVSPRVWRQDAK